ncbi:hypothetical protein INR49_015480 [Caranx melampygus]|nr:hypothetical protein INR49_015480 [Caranx melampygus]
MQTAEDSEHRAALDREETPYMASTLVVKAVTKPTAISMATDPDQSITDGGVILAHAPCHSDAQQLFKEQHYMPTDTALRGMKRCRCRSLLLPTTRIGTSLLLLSLQERVRHLKIRRVTVEQIDESKMCLITALRLSRGYHLTKQKIEAEKKQDMTEVEEEKSSTDKVKAFGGLPPETWYTWLELDGKEEIGGTSNTFSSYMFPLRMTEGLYTYLVLVGVYTSEKSL